MHKTNAELTGDIYEIFICTETSGSTYSYLVDTLGSTQTLFDSSSGLVILSREIRLALREGHDI